MTESEYIIDLAIRCKEGKISKYMFEKFYDCTINIIEFKVSNMEFPEDHYYMYENTGAIIEVIKILN